jgi:hypothetical protein
MSETTRPSSSLGWSHAETRRRQIAFGARLSPAERLAWLEDMLDEILPLLGKAREPERAPSKSSD